VNRLRNVNGEVTSGKSTIHCLHVGGQIGAVLQESWHTKKGVRSNAKEGSSFSELLSHHLLSLFLKKKESMKTPTFGQL
jgi:hypothetical protein